jgi:hypothetical protein
MGREDACLWSRPWLRYLATLVLGAKVPAARGGGPRATAAGRQPDRQPPAASRQPASPASASAEMGTSADRQP